ncbi:hypothetical protein Pfo_031610 [Paulownia fortunei]|nr:hypothetical protein Pfo_031610 [Paulownia fortunei]
MPDIDIDWPPSQREAIFEYLHQKYGKRNLVKLSHLVRWQLNKRCETLVVFFGLPVATLSKLSGGIPEGKNGRKVSIESALKEPKLLATIQTIDHGDLLLKTARQIEGLPKNYSTHAAGVVLSARPLNLTILSQALYHARQQLPQNFDISQISLDDEQTIALFAKGDTNGVFQFESSGIKHVLRDLKPVMFEHIVAVNALYRPGPSQNIHQFVARRHGRESVIILILRSKTILAPTFGIIVYQEQVIAMSKKKLDKMQALHEKFINGAITKVIPQAQAEKIFSYVDEFANYGFNRSHAVAYSKLAFQLAYMKAHYPVAFYTALLNANIGDQRKIQQYVSEAKSRGIVVLAPNINLSQTVLDVQ